MDRFNQVHNDIKPQNYLLKYLNGPNDLNRIDIVLTDFGLVGQDTKGGTPIFASPECFEIKTNSSDIFSLGNIPDLQKLEFHLLKSDQPNQNQSERYLSESNHLVYSTILPNNFEV